MGWPGDTLCSHAMASKRSCLACVLTPHELGFSVLTVSSLKTVLLVFLWVLKSK
jgi:hypothetical protein